MLVIVTNGEFFPGRGKLIKDLLTICPQITTIIQNYNHRDTNVILGTKERVLYGPGYIKDQILGLKFKVSSRSFFQVNHAQTEKLYSKALELSGINKNDIVLDAYAGVATIGLLASKYAKHVVSVEFEKSAVINAKNNAKNNEINNITIIEADCTKYIAQNNPQFDVVIMDPPRKGSTKEFISAIKKIKPRTIVYISCDPATLARDLYEFKDVYCIEYVQPVDMFPRTFHVETICALSFKGQK
jgi:23S rRNA (uracil1939-C5)-methyltransferase